MMCFVIAVHFAKMVFQPIPAFERFSAVLAGKRLLLFEWLHDDHNGLAEYSLCGFPEDKLPVQLLRAQRIHEYC